VARRKETSRRLRHALSQAPRFPAAAFWAWTLSVAPTARSIRRWKRKKCLIHLNKCRF